MQTFILPRVVSGPDNERLALANQEFDRCKTIIDRRHSSEGIIFGLDTALRLLMIEQPRHLSYRRKDDVCVWAPQPESRIRMKGVFSYSSGLSAGVLRIERENEDVLCTDPLSTCLQMAGYISREEMTVLLDILTRRTRIDKERNEEELLRIFETSGAFKGKVAARWAVKHHRINTDSSMETRLRLTLEESHFPSPSVNPMFKDPATGKIWFLDMAYIDLGIVFEYQGRAWHSSSSSLDNDSHKSMRLQHFGCKIITVTSESLTIPWRKDELIEAVRRARRQQQKLSKRRQHSFVNLFTEQEELKKLNH